jgi:hypothetical protein
MKTFQIVAAVVLAAGAAACGSSDSSPSSPTVPTFTVTMLPSNETTAVVGPEAQGTGTMTIKFNLTKDAGGNVTAATADFSGTFSNFPAGTTLTAAHIHPGAAGVAGSPIINLTLSSGEVVFANGGGTLTKNGVTISPVDLATTIMNNPSGYYFNIHTATNPGGAARGQLVRTQ